MVLTEHFKEAEKRLGFPDEAVKLLEEMIRQSALPQRSTKISRMLSGLPHMI